MLDIIYQDRDIVICVKPIGAESETAMPGLLREQLGGEAFCVHRLDTAVGGVMVYARSKQAAGKLSAAIAGDRLSKEYLAVVEGVPELPEGELEDLLLKDGAKGKSYVVKRERKGVKRARLAYKVLGTVTAEQGTCSLIWVRLYTGRFHQIRVQFASRKHPLLGDGKYGSKCNKCTTALWSCRLTLPHPRTGETITHTAAPPEAFPWNLFSSENPPVLQ